MRAIIIDDEQHITDMLQSFIRSFQLDVEIIGVFNESSNALDFCKKQKPELIISDICMPDLTGLELLHKVKNDLPQVYCLFISAYNEFEYAVAAMEDGACGYLLKPIQPSELYKRLKEICDKYDIWEKRQQKFTQMKTIVKKLQHEKTADVTIQQNNQYSRNVWIVLRYIEENYFDAISLDSASEVVFLNKNYLSMLFKREVGTSFVTYLNHFRINKAKNLLRMQDFKVNEVADMVGFNDVSYFIRQFKNDVGCTPNEYREKGNMQ